VFTAFAVVFVTRDEPTPPAPAETVAAPKQTAAVAARSPAVQEPIADQEEDEDGAIEVENQPAATEEPEAPPATRTPAPAVPRRTAAAPERDSVTVQREVKTASAPVAPEPGEEPGMELYRAAHRAHFVDRDPARALAAWDAYLREAPGGRFAAEARYNRALSLVRLGHHTAAAQALQPFADGRYGGYRQREARALLGELE
jgi:TolA-binding protein